MFSPRLESLPRFKLQPPTSPIRQRNLPGKPIQRFLLLACIVSTIWLVFDRKLASLEIIERSRFTAFEFTYGGTPVGASDYTKWLGQSSETKGSSVSSKSCTQKTRGKNKGQDPEGGKGQSEEKSLYKVRPEVTRIPFEEAVMDMTLAGWEDEWISSGTYDVAKHGELPEPKLDFVYNWVNGSDVRFRDMRHPYELESPLNDAKGKWIAEHSVNRYRDWDELRYSLRSLDAYAKEFLNKIQLLVNSVIDQQSGQITPQRPDWLNNDNKTNNHVEVLSQEAFFGEEERDCLPTFNSLSIESQIHLTPSTTDQLVGISDDMFLGMPHAASDFFSPLFGPTMAFKPDSYNVQALGGKDKWPTFGEKPFLYYTSYLLNHRFGERSRHVQAHLGHSVSRSVMKEALASFPQPALQGACERFRGESHFQIYPWYASFHYTIERFREALLWSFIFARSDNDTDGYLDWEERQGILNALEPGWRALGGQDSSLPVKQSQVRDRMYFRLPEELRNAGLQAPKANINVLWTSMDGPATMRNVKCSHFSVDECLGESFASPASDAKSPNPDFAAANVFSRLAAQRPECGDCLIKFLLEAVPRGMEPLLPPKHKTREREIIIKALKKYQHTIIDTDAMKFVMIKDSEQAETELLDRTVRRGKVYGQWCLNDDVMRESEEQSVRKVMNEVFETLWPVRGRWEK